MFIRSETFELGARIPARCAYGRIGPGGTIDSDNLNPALAWGEAPEGTKSFVLFCIDDDVPTVFDGRDAGGHLPAMQLRRRFVHWVQANIPVSVTSVAEGELANDKKLAAGFGCTGINDYSRGGVPAPGAVGTGYDGPCPPFFDARWHFYRFVVAALDVERLALPEPFRMSDVEVAIEGHVLDTAEIVGRYTLNPALAG